MASGDDWFRFLLLAVAPALRDALLAGDKETLEGLQAIDSTIWTGVRASESIMNHLVRETLRRMDPNDPDGAHKVRHEIMAVRESWRGLKWQGVHKTLLTLRDLGLIRIYAELEEVEEQGVKKARYREIALAPMWDPVLYEIKQSGVQRTVFGSVVGKLIGLSVTGKGKDALKLPILIARKAQQNGGKISEEEVEELTRPLGGGKRRFTDFEGRDALKPENVRFFKEYDGEVGIVNEKVYRAIERLNVVALEIYNQLSMQAE